MRVTYGDGKLREIYPLIPLFNTQKRGCAKIPMQELQQLFAVCTWHAGKQEAKLFFYRADLFLPMELV